MIFTSTLCMQQSQAQHILFPAIELQFAAVVQPRAGVSTALSSTALSHPQLSCFDTDAMPQLATLNDLYGTLQVSPQPSHVYQPPDSDVEKPLRIRCYEQQADGKLYIPEQTFTFMAPTEAREALATGEKFHKVLVATSRLPASMHLALYVDCNTAANTTGINKRIRQHLLTRTYTCREICQAMATTGEFSCEHETMEDQMRYIIKMRASDPSDQNKWMGALTKFLQLDKDMTQVWGGTLLSHKNLIKIASEEREKRQKVTHQACQEIFQSQNAIADWNLADGRTEEKLSMDMYTDSTIAEYATLSNPEPMVAELTYVAAGMVIDIAQKQGHAVLFSQATHNAVLQYLQRVTDAEIRDAYKQKVSDRVSENSVYVSDIKMKIIAQAVEAKKDTAGTGQWVHLELRAVPDPKEGGEDQQVVPGKVAGTCLFNSHQDLLKGRLVGDCEDMAAAIAGFGYILNMDKNNLYHLQRKTLASKFMPDDYKQLGALICSVTARVHTAFNPPLKNQKTMKMPPAQIRQELMLAASSQADKTNLSSTEKQLCDTLPVLTSGAVLASAPKLDSIESMSTKSVNMCDPREPVEKYTQAWQTALTSTSQNDARKPAGHCTGFILQLSNKRTCEVNGYPVNVYEHNEPFHIIEGTAQANKAQHRDKGVTMQVCLPGRPITPLRLKLAQQLQDKTIGCHFAKNIEAALHSKELEEEASLQTNEDMEICNATAIQLYTTCVPADSPDLIYATKYNFYLQLVSAGDYSFATATAEGYAEPGACLFRTFDKSLPIAVQTEMNETEEEACLFLGAWQGLGMLLPGEIPTKSFTPLQMRYTMNTALCPIMGPSPFLNSGIVIRTNTEPDATGNMKNLKAIAKHVHENIDPYANIEMSTFMDALFVRIKGG